MTVALMPLLLRMVLVHIKNMESDNFVKGATTDSEH